MAGGTQNERGDTELGKSGKIGFQHQVRWGWEQLSNTEPNGCYDTIGGFSKQSQ